MAEENQTALADNRLKIISIVLCILGILVATYLSWVKLTGTDALCPESTVLNCDVVQNSVYSEMFGIPIALFGLAGYVGILAALLLEGRLELVTEYGPLAELGMTLFGVLYSAYLTYLELFVLQAICPWCVVSAVLMVILFIITIIRYRRHLAGMES